MLDPSGVPDQLLPWLGGFFAIGFDPTWDADKRRKILHAAPQLYRLRGTVAGLEQAVETVFGVTPYIEELSSAGPWGSIDGEKPAWPAPSGASPPHVSLGPPPRLRAVRLFSRSPSPLPLRRSPLRRPPS